MVHLRMVLLSCVLVLTGLTGMIVPNIAHAQVGSGQATDCTNGCVLYTCNSGSCTVWHCDGAHGCVVVGQFKQTAQTVGARGRIANSSAINSAVFAKICRTERSCDLYKLTALAAIRVGTYDNIDGIVDQMKAQRAAGG